MWEFWTDWLPTETPCLPQNVEPRLLVARCGVAAVTGLQGADGLGGASEYLGSPRTRVAS